MGEPLRPRDESFSPTAPDSVEKEAVAAERPISRGGGLRSPSDGRRSYLAAPDDDRNLTFDQIHRKYNDRIYNVIYRWVGNADEAADLTVITFTNAWKGWDKFRRDARVSTWLHQIALNACKNQFKVRDRLREREVMSLDDSFESESGSEMSREVADWSYDPEKRLLSQEMVEKVREAIDALPSKYRVVLVLSEREDMSYEEIAQITQETVQNVKTLLHRARGRVRQRLEPYYRNWSGRREA